jgi:formamidopyrimidine-DNA glycosylase
MRIMPELPDVERFKCLLAENALGKGIERVIVNDARILGKRSTRAFVERLQGASLVEARRHGKHLMARLDRGGWLVLLFGMTGALHFVQDLDKEPPFSRVRLDFTHDGHLAYTNKRMIGHVDVVDDAEKFIAREKLGPDALDPRFDLSAFKEAVTGIKRDVKSVLMNQEIVAGIGNIYSDEILFQARVDPKAKVCELPPARLKHLFAVMRKVFETAVARGAGSEEFTDRVPQGALLPERRKGGHCPRCHSDLSIAKVGGRTSYSCPRCQSE